MKFELGLIYYNLRCKNYSTAVEEATRYLHTCANKSDKHGKLSFWKACASGFSGFHQDAIRELEAMRRSYRHLELAVVSALIWLHQKADFADEDELQKLDVAFNTAQSCVHIDGALLSADFYLHANDYEAAYACLKQPVVMKIKNSKDGSKVIRESNVERCRIQLWLNIMFGSRITHSAGGGGDAALYSALEKNVENVENFDCLMARAKYEQTCGNIAGSLDLLATTIAKNDSFYPAHIESSKIYITRRQYRLSRDSAKRALTIAQDNIEALQLIVLLHHIASCDKSEYISNLKQLVHLLVSAKNTSMKACFQNAQLLSRLCGNHDKVTLEFALSLISKAHALNRIDVSVRLEKAKILQRLGRYQKAIAEYQLISTLNESSIEASRGIVLCQALNGNFSDARDQLAFITLVEEEESRELETHTIIVLLTDWKSSNEKEAFSRLFDSLYIKIKSQSTIQNDIFDPSMHFDLGDIIDIVKHYLMRWPSGFHDIVGIRKEDDWKAITDKVAAVLNVVVDRYPSNIQTWILLIKVKFQLNQLREARGLLDRCLSIHPNSGLCHLVMAQIQLGVGDIMGSHQSLERGLSENFGIRNHPFYCFLKGSVCLKEAVLEEAKDFLEEAIKYNEKIGGRSDGGHVDDTLLMSLDDRVSCYIEYGKVLKALNQYKLLEKISLQAEQKFEGLSKSFHFIKLRSDVYLEQNKTEMSLRILMDVPPESPFYAVAQMEQAEIYLHKERDIKSFIQCHEALMKIENTPQGHMYMALGDAYMKAGLYRQALEAYSNGLEICPHEEKIARSVGDTLIFLHEYQKATGHYEHFLEKNPGNIKISLELSSLYMSTNQLSKAHRILALLIEKNDASSLKDPQQFSDYVILFLNLSKVLFYQGEYIKSKETLMKAINLAKKFTKMQLSKSECCDKIKEMISSLVVDLTDKLRKQDNTLEGLNLCEAAIEYTEGDERILFPTIKLLVVAKKIDECRAYCKKLQLINPAHEGTIIVLGNLLVSQSQFDEAQSHYRDVIEKYPHSYEVIYEYLNLLKRMDREDEMKAIIESLSADFSNKKETAIVGGYNLCQGLYNRLTGNLPLALEYFSRSRRDESWREETCINMIEIYLRLDDYDFWFDQKNKSKKIPKSTIDSVQVLLQELTLCGTINRKVELFKGYLELMNCFENGLFVNTTKRFDLIVGSEMEYIPALLGIASSHLLQVNKTKLRNTLKRIAKIPYTSDHWKEFEKSYLLLASSYVQREKMDLALDLCKRCLFYNKSCKKAWELMGCIIESKNDNVEAINCYRKCWKLGHESSLTIGSRLAILFLRTKEYANAIDIATQILKRYPDYPQMTSILEKCVLSLRP